MKAEDIINTVAWSMAAAVTILAAVAFPVWATWIAGLFL